MAAVGALGAAYAMADVFSANTVGFVNLVLPNDGWHMIVNPLNNTNNNLSSIIPSGIPSGSSIWRWDATAQNYSENCSFAGAGAPGDIVWEPDSVINPGEGFLLGVFTDGVLAPPYTITFVGDVMQNPVGGPPLSTTLKPHWNMVGSQVPQQGDITADLKYVVQDGDEAWSWDGVAQNWGTYFISDAGGQVWDPPLVLTIGQAILLGSQAGGAWTRDFQVQ